MARDDHKPGEWAQRYIREEVNARSTRLNEGRYDASGKVVACARQHDIALLDAAGQVKDFMPASLAEIYFQKETLATLKDAPAGEVVSLLRKPAKVKVRQLACGDYEEFSAMSPRIIPAEQVAGRYYSAQEAAIFAAAEKKGR